MKGNNFIGYTKFEMASVDDGLLSVENRVMKLLGVLQKRWVRIQFCSASVRAVRLSFKGLFIIPRGLIRASLLLIGSAKSGKLPYLVGWSRGVWI